ncbi:hypothetical protein ABI_01200 [Asticcacaulis biprosthecium C19]|uniref:Uncharacterized protein n=1 Tax=Asticcacaulis biprosthecium C19 TaxID=715226 RepID=F4QHY0_9CAUL|nr:hypothetical protein ABI_01200 [Asticcacaulis biprosthecium C19]
MRRAGRKGAGAEVFHLEYTVYYSSGRRQAQLPQARCSGGKWQMRSAGCSAGPDPT